MEYEKKHDPTTPPPPYASAPYQPGPYQPGPYQPGPGVPYSQPYPATQQHPEGSYPPGQGSYPPGAYPQQPGGYFVHQGGQYQQQGQQVGVTPVIVCPVVQQGFVSMIGAIVLSCFVFWCCGIICGAIAFILALVGQNSSSDGNSAGAIRLRNASYAVSVVGIVFGIAVIVTLVVISNNSRRHYY